MPKARIAQVINNMFQDYEYGFEAFTIMKDDPAMRRFVLYEGSPINVMARKQKSFKEQVKNSIVDYIREEYLSDEAEYELAENIADNQRKFYVIEQDDSYKPFEFFKRPIDNIEMFKMELLDNVQGIAFMFKRENIIIWGYQHLYAVTIPNKSKKNWLSIQDAEVFKEMAVPMLPIAKRVNLLVIGSEIITKDISLMQRLFGFESFIRNSATKVIRNINKLDLITNIDKLTTYAERSNLRYAKKMMRIRHSAVLNMSAEELLNKVKTLPRWSGKFSIEDNHIVLNTYANVENLIDLLDERYTRSDVTGEEYSTDVKKIAPPIG
ncbi:DUF4868 domain-containing protein [Sporolactobacillus laevolacticus]|uniref:DUF4868 domain-containing protein n=1 Tax=Sporolactobacillus laevolacticus TaxID=33018 RepID=UPI0025B43562|nr:DUF4868 domain-containing protein [Sporolactobacillus laevolacticus]MDN3956806.1 DUF4868 domain-containing protein [Sporolactobacillus laevolacticus]